MAVQLTYIGLLGLIVGSFANVVVHRVPGGQSVVSPASRCPSCGHRIRHRHNVPVVSWFALRGRCADCGAPISARYPLVELGTGVLFAATTLRLDALDKLPALAAYLFFDALGVVLALIDLDVRRLPDVIVLPSYPVVLLLLTVAAGWDSDWGALERAALGGASLFAFYLLVVRLYPAGMGWGDVKLSGLIGVVLAYLSWGSLLVGAFTGFLLGSIVGVAVIASRHGSRKSALPFGPFMIAGAGVAIFSGEELASWYLHLTTGS
jgi:leader peptidase (prepilin peptidase) / N-methyltransferase